MAQTEPKNLDREDIVSEALDKAFREDEQETNKD